MANEASIRVGIEIRKGNLQYRPAAASFRATVTGSKGPTPGAIAVSTTGTSVDLSELTTPGLCRICNLDSTNYVTYGLYDDAQSQFLPLGEILPGEEYVFRFSREFGDSLIGTGTDADNVHFRLKANTAACNVSVEAFEK